MASPSFVYAFDNLSPSKFVELCGLLLGARYKGFLLSAPGPDGGVDGEQDPYFGRLTIEEKSLLLDKLLPEDGVLVFQFKHKVVARVGESISRSDVLQQFKSTRTRESEVLKPGVVKLNPRGYVLVTNLEVNSIYRKKFIDLCKIENSNIEHYQIIGLDELESWVILERDIRSQYFPLLYGRPRFNLKLKLQHGQTFKVLDMGEVYRGGQSDTVKSGSILCLSIMNIGEQTSYVASVKFKALVDGKVQYFMQSPIPKGADPLCNPSFGEPLAPGRCLEYRFSYKIFSEFKMKDHFVSEVLVIDQIDNSYTLEISEEIRHMIYEHS